MGSRHIIRWDIRDVIVWGSSDIIGEGDRDGILVGVVGNLIFFPSFIVK